MKPNLKNPGCSPWRNRTAVAVAKFSIRATIRGVEGRLSPGVDGIIPGGGCPKTC